MDVYLGNTKLKLNPADSIAKGGEADIFKLPNNPNMVLKLFKQPDHPDLAGMPNEQTAAKFRLQEHQTKLLAIPKGLPDNIVTPVEIAYITQKSSGRAVAGYSMPFVDGANTLLSYSDMNFKKAVPFSVQMSILRNLREAVVSTHRGSIILGDFNDLNVLVVGDKIYLIDIDSTQFGQFLCYVFTQRFLDPLLASFDDEGLSLTRPYVPDADWYAFSIMVMQTLLSAGPYSGVTDRKNQKGKRLKYHERVADRLTVFDPSVKYPRNAVPYGSLPDELSDYLYNVFVKDQRGEFPDSLLQIVWQKCSTCGIWHARPTCPACAQPAAAAVKQKVRVRGNVTSTRVFKTKGNLVFASVDSGKLEYLYHENNTFFREGETFVVKGPLDPMFRYRIQGKRTLVGRRNQVIVIEPGQENKNILVDAVGNLALFDSNRDNYFWVRTGNLMRSHPMGGRQIGQVLPNQSLFWVGNKRGFGFYSAGNVKIAFVFDPVGRGIKDNIQPLNYTGQLVDSTCVFTHEAIWVLYSSQEGGLIKNRCRVYNFQGQVLANAEAVSGDGSWLGTIRGKTALGNRVLSVTPDGIVRLHCHNSIIGIEAEYPDTEPFVDEGCHLFINPDGLYVVDAQEIRLITIK
jgi:hypothetical protein